MKIIIYLISQLLLLNCLFADTLPCKLMLKDSYQNEKIQNKNEYNEKIKSILKTLNDDWIPSEMLTNEQLKEASYVAYFNMNPVFEGSFSREDNYIFQNGLAKIKKLMIIEDWTDERTFNRLATVINPKLINRSDGIIPLYFKEYFYMPEANRKLKNYKIFEGLNTGIYRFPLKSRKGYLKKLYDLSEQLISEVKSKKLKFQKYDDSDFYTKGINTLYKNKLVFGTTSVQEYTMGEIVSFAGKVHSIETEMDRRGEGVNYLILTIEDCKFGKVIIKAAPSEVNVIN